MTVPESDGAQIEVVRVFTDQAGRFGNPLGIVRHAAVAGVDHQALAARVGYSETVVVDDPADGRVRMRIYTPAVELPFAGHPSVGTAWWLSDQRQPVHIIDVPAGPVEVTSTDGITWARARAEWTPDFEFHEFEDAAEIATLDPGDFPEGKHYCWGWTNEPRGAIRSRMFAPAMGVAEDEATGAAAVRLTALLTRGLKITQGEGSQIFTEWDSDGWARVGGRVVADHPIVV
ncbi:PhzF family phenazine biosynthesis protein [Nocardia yunnanensis]|uniref:PhzF family phenazine biosynthesis protein n=1 Tax=Nocardia yunnanensis TaxID=2382165 RepID=A0A386ZLE1_9NOCA|nr:PhzF family phenazine biosynthesis protein [Nocardia yunnanensis]AYF78248.1 PhzF family phenazine biosynthesis protein [Nocardia yunnanensis]